ncbi:MAG: hypothetical protein PHQ47_00275 [Candidatus Portnoybacteria bacterium]|nr:hypothetical protein [Candidatus Portnoybacteria bacterium]
MDIFEKKYGIKESKKIKDFHRGRRMFCIYDGKLHIAKSNLPYSHAVWFVKEGWMPEDDDKLMDKAARGIIDAKGDIYFYTGYDFKIDSEIDSTFFLYLNDLVRKLKLNINKEIFGGLIRKKPGEKWPPIKKYGKIKKYLK